LQELLQPGQKLFIDNVRKLTRIGRCGAIQHTVNIEKDHFHRWVGALVSAAWWGLPAEKCWNLEKFQHCFLIRIVPVRKLSHDVALDASGNEVHQGGVAQCSKQHPVS
jgi:hypothetical protein